MLRQVLKEIAATGSEVDYSTLDSVLRNMSRSGTNPIYEPLHPFTCQEGLAHLVKRGDLVPTGNWRWRIKKTGWLTRRRMQ